MQRNSTLYIISFAAIVCVICSIFVAGAAVALKSKQQQNLVLDRQRKVLSVCGLIEPRQSVAPQEVQRLFDERIETKYVDLGEGSYVDPSEVPSLYDPVRAAKDPSTSTALEPNAAQVPTVPRIAVVYQAKDESGAIDQYVLQVWGKGLWSTMYGYLALDKDGVTVRGLTFYEHGETPGLGGEVDNPKWKALWPGRKVFDSSGEPVIDIVKGGAGSPEEDPHRVDGLSGATITSNGVEHLINLWMGEHGYGPFLAKLKEGSV